MIEIKNLCKSYEGKVIYKALNVCFEESKMTSIIGASGCGKTTLLRILAGLEPYESGEIIGIQGKKIAYVFQEDRLMPWLSVKENIAYVLCSHFKAEVIQHKVRELLKIFQLEAYEEAAISALSGGMQRRVAIARALAYESNLLLLDEPFKGLDDTLKWQVWEDMKKYLEVSHQTVICVTHDQEMAHQFTDQINIEKLINNKGR